MFNIRCEIWRLVLILKTILEGADTTGMKWDHSYNKYAKFSEKLTFLTP